MSMTLEDFEKAHGLDGPQNPRAVAGNNNPPAGAIERSKDTLADLQQFLKDEPVICDEDKARYAKGLIERAKSSWSDMDAERDGKVRPLNERVREINANYKSPMAVIRSALDLATGRLDTFFNEQREKAEEEARKAAEEAERKIQEANDAIKAKTEAAENAGLGEVGIDVVAAEQEAAQKVAEANRAIRVANRAERDTNIRVGGGFGRVMTQRTKETLIVTDWQKAITEMGFVDGIRDAVLTAGRAYRKLKGDLPEGIVSEKEKSL
jgi:hypothetical protein